MPVRAPQCRVRFYPQEAQNLGQTIYLDPTNRDSLIAVQTTKDLNQQAGTFTVTLAPENLAHGKLYWQDILRPGDLTVIEMGPDAPDPVGGRVARERGYFGLEPVMVGSIDDVRLSTGFSQPDGKPQRVLVVTGRDLGKQLIEDQVWWDSWSQPVRAVTGLDPEVNEWSKAKWNGGVAAGLFRVVLKYVADNYEIVFYRQGSGAHTRTMRLYQDLLGLHLTLDSPVVNSPFGQLAFSGAPWAMMERAAGKPLFVLQYDLRRSVDLDTLLAPARAAGKLDQTLGRVIDSPYGNWESRCALMYYRNPWSNRDYDDWTSLPTRVVEDWQIVGMEIGRGNEEVSNTWQVWTDVQGTIRPVTVVSLDEAEHLRDYDLINRYGSRPMILNSPFISGIGATPTMKLAIPQFSKRLKDWNRWNEWFLSGSFTIQGRAAVRVGDRLWHWDADYGSADGPPGSFQGGVDYYVERVDQDFHQFQGWTTGIGVTRGQRHREPGESLDYTDIMPTEPLLHSHLHPSDARPNSPFRQAIRKQVDRVRVWGRTRL